MGKERKNAKSNKKPVNKKGENSNKKKIFIVAGVVLAIALVITAIVIFAKPNEEIPADVQTVQAFYSTKSLEGEFIVQFQNFEAFADFYDSDGTYIKFKGSEKIYDQEGNEISRDNLVPGDTLEIYFDGTVANNNPKTIEAYKIVKITH